MDLITEMDGPFTATLEAAPSILVAYFPCTGNTEAVAGRLSDILAADLYEIVPEDPYTSADLDYSDPSSRASQEQNDAAARPAISDEVTGMEGYNVVFLGYPIWWGRLPGSSAHSWTTMILKVRPSSPSAPPAATASVPARPISTVWRLPPPGSLAAVSAAPSRHPSWPNGYLNCPCPKAPSRPRLPDI